MANSDKVKPILDFLRQIGIDTTKVGSDIVKWAIDNPEAAFVAYKVCQSAIAATKSAGGVAPVVAALMNTAREVGWKKVIPTVAKNGIAAAGGGKAAVIAGAKALGKLAAVAAAIKVAESTVKTAIQSGHKEWNELTHSKNFGSGMKNVWDLVWETSIPGSTVTMIRNVFRGNGSSKEAEQATKMIAAIAEGKEAAFKQASEIKEYSADMAKRDSVNSEYYQDRVKAATDMQAAALGMVPRPSNPQAENEWRKAVEANMKTEKKQIANRSNDPKWYWKGNADKLIAGTLTWSDVKTNHKTLPLVAVTTITTDLVLPLVDSKLPVKVRNNYEALFAALRGPNTGAYNYAAEDVFYYTTYLYSFITRIRFLQKIIKAAHTHKVEQDDLARILTDKIAGFNNYYNQIIQDGPNLISKLNALSEDINTWPLIGTSWLSRWNYLADKCIKDYNGPKAVLGVYVVRSIFGLNASTGKPEQKEVMSSSFANTIAALQTEYAAFKALSGTLNVTNCMLKIAGDMCKLLGTNSGVFNNVPYMDQCRPGALTFDYDEEAKFQLQNAKLAGRDQNISSWVLPSFDGSVNGVYPYSNTLGTSALSITGTDPYNQANPWVVVNDSAAAVRTDANNIEMTQFVYNADVTQNDGNGHYVQTMVDVSIAIFAYFQVCYYQVNGTGGSTTFGFISTFCNPGGNTSYQDVMPWQLFVAIRQIDFLPSPVILTGSGTKTIQGRYIDVDNYAQITAEQIKNYISVATYSLSYTYSMEDVDLKSKIKR